MNRIMGSGLCVVMALLTSSLSHAQDSEVEPAPSSEESLRLRPQLQVGTGAPGCSVEAQRLVDQLQLSIARSQHSGPTVVESWYRGPLAASYLAPPLGFAIAAFAADKDTIVPPVLAGLLGVALPPIIHAAHGNAEGAWYSLLGIVGSVAVGALLGAAVGHVAPGNAPRGDAQEQNALIFGYATYSLWALLDTAFFARTTSLQP